MRTELVRKSIHLCSTSIPLFYLYTDELLIFWILLPVSLIFMGTDLLRLRWSPLWRWIHQHFSSHFRQSEHTTILASTSLLLAMLLLVGGLGELAGEKDIVVLALLFVCVGDAMAALVGTAFGRVRVTRSTTLEGTLTFIICGCLATLLVPSVPLLIWAGGLAVATILEIESGPMQDNFTIPIGSAGIMWALRYFVI